MAREQHKRVLIRYSRDKIAKSLDAPGFIQVNVWDPSLGQSTAVVIDSAGQILDEQIGGDLTALIVRNAPAPPVAAALLSAALETAKAENKRVLLDFRADWCAPCLRLDRFLHQPDVAARLKEAYILVTVDLGFGQGGRELAYTLGSIESDGLPWIAVLDQAGQVLRTSTKDKRNIGFPATPDDKREFARILGIEKFESLLNNF